MSKSNQVWQKLVYADIFNWPLSAKELGFKPAALRPLVKPGKIQTQAGWYFLPGKTKNIRLRQQRFKTSQPKIARAKMAAKLLTCLPGIKLVAVTGNVAVNNARPTDDIDLLIITSAQRLWLVRPLAIFFLEILGWRRRPNDQRAKDKLCLNLWLDETGLELPAAKQNWFTAQEIKQLKVLINKNGIYEKFLKANSWLKNF